MQSCKSGRAFRVGFGFGPGSGLQLIKTSGLNRARDVLFVVGTQNSNQNIGNIAEFFRPNLAFVFVSGMIWSSN